MKLEYLIALVLVLLPKCMGWELDDDEKAWFEEIDSPTNAPKERRFTREGLCDHDPLTSLMLKSLLDSQIKMRTGDASRNMPPIDPMNISSIHLNVENEKHVYNVSLLNVMANNLSFFDINYIRSDLAEMSCNVSISINSFSISGEYGLRGLTKMRLIWIPIFGKGIFHFEPRGATVSVYGKLGYNSNNTLELEEFDFGLSMESMNVQFTGIMGAGARVSRALNKVFNAIGLKLFNKVEPRIHERVRARGIMEINRMLKGIQYNGEMFEEAMQQTIYCLYG